MPEVCADTSAHSVSQAALGPNVIEQARGEATTECFVEDADGVVVGIGAGSAEANHADVALVYVLFRNEIVAGFGWIKLDVWLGKCWTLRPRFECGPQTRFHRRRIEVSGDSENDVIGMHVFCMPFDEILTRHRCDRRVLG